MAWEFERLKNKKDCKFFVVSNRGHFICTPNSRSISRSILDLKNRISVQTTFHSYPFFLSIKKFTLLPTSVRNDWEF